MAPLVCSSNLRALKGCTFTHLRFELTAFLFQVGVHSSFEFIFAGKESTYLISLGITRIWRG